MSLDFLNDPTGAAPAVTPEAQPEPQPQPEPAITPEPAPGDIGQPRDEQGRFAPIAPTEPAATPPVAPEPAPQPGHVPVSALQEERQRRQALEAELQRIQQGAMESGIPDPYADPEGYAAYHQQQVQSAVLNTRLDISEDIARSKHGDQTVDQVLEWVKGRFTQSPAYQQEVLAQRNPYEFAVQAWKREQTLSSFDPSEFEAFRAWKAAQNPLTAAPQQPLAASPPPPVAPPPQSLAAAPSAGVAAHVPTGPGVAFDGLFKR